MRCGGLLKVYSGGGGVKRTHRHCHHRHYHH